jgi:hypothetical protein
MKILLNSPFKEEKVQKKKLWKQYCEMVKLYFSLNYMPYEYYCFKFDHKDCSDRKILEFLPYSWFLYKVNLNLTPGSWESLFNNKLLFNIYAKHSGLKVPEDFGIYNIHYGYDLTGSESLRSAVDLELFFRKHLFKTIVIKDLSGTQGKNIFFASDINYREEVVVLTIDEKKYSTQQLAVFLGKGEYLFQEELKNSPFINGIYPNSLNTFRTITFLTKDKEVRILGAFLRTGIGKNKVDNWHAGGLLIPIDSKEGKIIDYGYDFSYHLYEKHPDTLFAFRDNKIPQWDELISLAKKGASAFPMMHFIAWDFAFTDKGLVIVEANIREINIFVNQLSDIGLAGLIRDDLKGLGYDFPLDKIPPVTLQNISNRLFRVTRNLLRMGY